MVSLDELVRDLESEKDEVVTAGVTTDNSLDEGGKGR